MDIATIEKRVAEFFNNQSEKIINNEYVKTAKLVDVMPLIDTDVDLQKYEATFHFTDIIFKLTEPQSAIDDLNHQNITALYFNDETNQYVTCPTWDKPITMAQIREMLYQNATTQPLDFVACFEQVLHQIAERSRKYVIDSYNAGGVNCTY